MTHSCSIGRAYLSVSLHAGGRGEEATATCYVTVHVTDVNDNSPQWSEQTPTVISWTGRTTAVTARDSDSTLTYSLHAGQSL